MPDGHLSRSLFCARLLLLNGFVRACGSSICKEQDCEVQHLVYLAEAVGFPGFNYNFGWFDNKWPTSPELTHDFAALTSEVEDEAVSAFACSYKLHETLMSIVKSRVLPLLDVPRRALRDLATGEFQGEEPLVPLDTWITILARIRFMILKGHTRDEAVDTVIIRAQEEGLIAHTLASKIDQACEAALNVLVNHGLASSDMVYIHSPRTNDSEPKRGV